MRHPRRWVVVLAPTIAILAFSGCSTTAAPRETEPAARVEPVTAFNRVVISATAAQRIGLETETVRPLGVALVIPYSSIVYDSSGKAWSYIQAAPNVFQREAVSIDAINGTDAVLSHGPPVGTAVVSVGAAELYGLEFGGAE